MNRTVEKSLELLKVAEEFIPVQSQTFSKSAKYFVKGVSPLFLQSGKGCKVTDVDGNIYTDYISALCPITLGYCYPAVDKAIIAQLHEGIIFSQPHPKEIELAEIINTVIPSAEMVRYTKTGSEACQGVVRLARAFTGREKIAFRGYHGWHDWYAITTEMPKGIPKVLGEYAMPFEYNDLGSLEKIFVEHPNEIAAVIMEPTVSQLPKGNFLQEVKRMAHHYGALLIFDEIVTGFRMSLGGAQEYFNVIPDLSTFGKGCANGMPLNLVCGRSDIMRECEEVFFSGTFGGEVLSIAASIATINEMIEKETIDHCWEMGNMLMDGLNSLEKGIHVFGYPCRPIYDLYDNSPEVKTLFMQECVKKGILAHAGYFNISYSHKEKDIQELLNVCEAALKTVDAAVTSNTVMSQIEGDLIKPAFRRL